MIAPTEARRCSSGLSVIRMRPLLSVTLVPSMPMNDERVSTAGSRRMAWARARWRWAMAGNETLWGASEMPRITPVSWIGNRPFGIATYSRRVSPSVATATSRVAGW